MSSNKSIKYKERTTPKLEDIDNRSVAIQQAELYSGPLPHPDLLSGYEKICKGAADRIIAMAELEGQSRRDFNNEALKAATRNEISNRRYACFLSTLIIGLGFILLYTEHYITGTIFSLPGLVVTYQAYLGKNNENRKDE